MPKYGHNFLQSSKSPPSSVMLPFPGSLSGWQITYHIRQCPCQQTHPIQLSLSPPGIHHPQGPVAWPVSVSARAGRMGPAVPWGLASFLPLAGWRFSAACCLHELELWSGGSGGGEGEDVQGPVPPWNAETPPPVQLRDGPSPNGERRPPLQATQAPGGLPGFSPQR